MELHEEIRRARKDLGLSQDRLAELCGIQRRQLSILERGGNVTLNTLRKVIGFLPNLEEFTFEQVRMKPTYIDYPPFEWSLFYVNLHNFQKTLEDVSTAIKAWLENPPGKDVPPEVVAKRTTTLATEIVKAYAHTIDPAGEELKAEEERLQREEERRQRAKEQRKRRREERGLEELLAAEGLLDDDEEPAEDE
jgi:transcriptional regulator with XRE-family HTH domain